MSSWRVNQNSYSTLPHVTMKSVGSWICIRIGNTDWCQKPVKTAEFTRFRLHRNWYRVQTDLWHGTWEMMMAAILMVINVCVLYSWRYLHKTTERKSNTWQRRKSEGLVCLVVQISNLKPLSQCTRMWSSNRYWEHWNWDAMPCPGLKSYDQGKRLENQDAAWLVFRITRMTGCYFIRKHRILVRESNEFEQ